MRLKRACSINNGIIFYSECDENYVTMATIDEDENIKVEWLPKEVAEKKSQNDEQEKKEDEKLLFMTLSLSGPMILPLFRLLCLNIWNPRILPILVLNTIICLILSLFINRIVFKSLYIKERQFHAAEHMIVNAYNKLNKIPTIEELSQASRFSRFCGTNALAMLLSLCIVILLLLYGVNARLCLEILLATLFSEILGCLNVFQLFTTKKPSKMELKVAIIGASAWLENEQNVRKNNLLTSL